MELYVKDSFEASVSVIIPHHNGIKTLTNCLDSLLSTEYRDFEIIVVDDCSFDNSAEIVEYKYEKVKIVRMDENLGFGASCNEGARHASGEILVFLNNDTEVSPNWLSELVSSMDKYDASFATPKILFLNDDREKVINAAGGVCDIFGIGWNRGNGYSDLGQYEQPEKVFYGSACLAVRDRAWKEVGGFDESYFMYVEDVDLCWRAKLLGYDTYYVPKSVIYHHWRKSGQDPNYIVRFVFRNNLTTMLKNYNLKTMFLTLPIYSIMKGFELIYFLSRSRKMFRLMLSGLIWNIKSIRKTFKKRKRIQSTRKINDLEILRQMQAIAFEVAIITGKVKHPLGKFLTSRNTDPIEAVEHVYP